MKIIVAGGGKVGSVLVRQLTEEGHEVTIIDKSGDVLENLMQEYDVISVQGNAASMDVLKEAGIRNTELLIAATDVDEVNLLTCLSANSLNPSLHTIARIRDHDYRSQALNMQELFNINMAINPEYQAAAEISRLLNFPGFFNIDTFAKGHVEIVSLRIKADSPLNGARLNKMNDIVHTQVLVCAVQRSGSCIIPDGNFELKENDLLYITASTTNLTTLLKNLGIITKKIKSVLIAGGSLLSFYLAGILERRGMNVTLIEKDHDRCVELAELLKNTTIVEGDASSQSFLESEGFENFDALVTLTGLDELNIVMSLYGNYRKIPQIITKLSHAENNRMLDSLPLGSVISPKELVCNTIVRYVRAMQNKVGAAITIHRIADGQGEAIEFEVTEDTLFIGTPLKNLSIKPNILIASITKGDRNEIPTGNSAFHKGDRVIIVTTKTSGIRQLNDIFVS